MLTFDTQFGPLTVRAHGPADGPLLLALHSSGSEGAQWDALAARFGRHRVWAPNLFGHVGAGPWTGADPLHFETQIAALAEVLDEVHKPVVLVGHSLGGLIAARLAASRPTQVRGLALYEPVVFGLLHDAPPQLDDAPNLMRAFELWDPDAPEVWMRAFVGYWSGAGIWDILPPARQAALLEVAHGVHDEAKAVTFDETSGAVFETARAKTVVVHGTESPPASRAMAERLTQRIEGEAHVHRGGAAHGADHPRGRVPRPRGDRARLRTRAWSSPGSKSRTVGPRHRGPISNGLSPTSSRSSRCSSR